MAETFAGSLTGVDTHDPAKERVAGSGADHTATMRGHFRG